ncbi:MAG: primosomal protein N' [Desulfomonilaceae bacterium]
MSNKTHTVQIAFQLPIHGVFSYLTSHENFSKLSIGSRVLVSFQKKIRAGFVVELGPQEGQPEQLKEIDQVLDEPPYFDRTLWRLLIWSSDYYMVPLGLALKTALPPGSDRKSKPWAVLTPTGRTAFSKAKELYKFPSVKKLLKKGAVPFSQFTADFDGAFLKEAVKNDYFVLEERIATPTYRIGNQNLPELLYSTTVSIGTGEKPMLTADQKNAVDKINVVLEEGHYSPFLLFGVTGSGKTEVYLHAIEKALSLGKSSLMLVPEIALTPQTARRFIERFGGGISVFHSGLTDSQRLDEWRRVSSGNTRIVIAARSGIFLPIPRLGLIIVDEEHDTSYKQEDSFTYNARDLALVRGKFENLCVILGSATPSFETFENVINRKIGRLDLPTRVHGGSLPETKILDLKTVFPVTKRKYFLTPAMLEAIDQTLEDKGQVALFLNRRGFDTLAQCSACGAVVKCPNCDISLTHHKKAHSLRCHICGYAKVAPPTCPVCSSENLVFSGVGTQKIEEKLGQLFPSARIARLDRDSTQKRDSLNEILTRFRNRDIDILTGTQMIVKGHDFPGISLVGILCGDSALHFPDFRSSERTFQTLVQVSGRTGRESQHGKVLLQTFDPDHYAIQLAATHDYDQFFERDSGLRRELSYPPYGHLILIRIEGSNFKRVEEKALQVGRIARKIKQPVDQVSVLGPAPAPRKKALGKHRWQILFKGQDRWKVRNIVTELRESGVLKAHGMRISIDVDPINLI